MAAPSPLARQPGAWPKNSLAAIFYFTQGLPRGRKEKGIAVPGGSNAAPSEKPPQHKPLCRRAQGRGGRARGRALGPAASAAAAAGPKKFSSILKTSAAPKHAAANTGLAALVKNRKMLSEAQDLRMKKSAARISGTAREEVREETGENGAESGAGRGAEGGTVLPEQLSLFRPAAFARPRPSGAPVLPP